MTIDDAALLFPVGHLLGSDYDEETGTVLQRVRVGPDVIYLNGPRYTIWALAHGGGERGSDQPWNRAAVLQAAEGLPDPAATVDALLADGLLAAVGPDAGAAETFAREHRLVPLMLGLGNLPDAPEVYQIGLPGQPVLQVSAAVFDLYRWAQQETDLWSASQRTGARFGDPTALINALVAVLHTLVAPGSACLDTRQPA